MRILLVAVALLGMFSLIGCAAPVKHMTASGKAEVTIQGAPRANVGSYLTNEMMNSGYHITRQTDFLLAFDRPVDNVFAAAMLGSRYDSTPSSRVTYTMAELNGATRVVADLQIVTNPGSAFERFTDANENADSMKFQQLLDRARSALEK